MSDEYDHDHEPRPIRVLVLDDLRNASSSRDHRTGSARLRVPGTRTYSIPPSRSQQTAARAPVHRESEPYYYARARTARDRLPEIGQVIELGAEAIAAALPLPEPPPPTSGDLKLDCYNQDQHRHAIAARQLAAERIRAIGKVANALSRFFAE